MQTIAPTQRNRGSLAKKEKQKILKKKKKAEEDACFQILTWEQCAGPLDNPTRAYSHGHGSLFPPIAGAAVDYSPPLQVF